MAVLDLARSVSLLYVIPAALITFIVYIVIQSKRARLDDIPGPWLARYTDAWRAYEAWKSPGSDTNYQIRVFKLYGDVVRIGPTTVLVSDPEAINTVLGFKTRLEKQYGMKPRMVHFGALYDNLRVAHAYSLSSLKAYEPYIDNTIDTLITELDKHADNHQAINMTNWLHFWAFDTVVKLTFGAPLGFMEKGSDFNGMIKAQRSTFRYIGIVSNFPTLDSLLKRNPVLKWAKTKPSVFFTFAKDIVDRRVAEARMNSQLDSNTKGYPDLLASFIAAKKTYPNVVTDHRLYHYTTANVVAGANSTSLALDQVMLYLASNPEAQERLFREIRSLNESADNHPVNEAGKDRHDNEGPAALDLVLKLPFLEAVILESYRKLNSPNNNLERIAPQGGLRLPSGHNLPAGTNVAMNSAPISNRADIYGADAADFSPVRWMRQEGESDSQFEERRLGMERASLTFGHGSRSCIGKNVVQLEVFKVWATLVGRFKFAAVGQPRPHHVVVMVQRRERANKQVKCG